MIYDFSSFIFHKMKKKMETIINKKIIQIEIYNIFLAMYIQHGPLSFVTFVLPFALFFFTFNVPFIFMKGVRFLGLVVIIIVKYDFVLLT